MKKVLILGASGGIARVAIEMFLEDTDARLTLYLRNARRLKGGVADPARERVVEGDVLEDSDLDYTILRPGWFTNADEIDYELTHKGEPFKGHDVSRRSVAALVVKLAESSGLEVRGSLGISKPE